MPCFSRVTTKLADLEAIQGAAQGLGLTVEVHDKHRITVTSRAGERLQLSRMQVDQPFGAYAFTAGQRAMLSQLTAGYATARVKAFAKKRGYMVSRGSTQGEFVLTKYS